MDLVLSILSNNGRSGFRNNFTDGVVGNSEGILQALVGVSSSKETESNG